MKYLVMFFVFVFLFFFSVIIVFFFHLADGLHSAVRIPTVLKRSEIEMSPGISRFIMLYDKNQRNKVILHDGISSVDKVIRTGVILFILLIFKKRRRKK